MPETTPDCLADGLGDRNPLWPFEPPLRSEQADYFRDEERVALRIRVQLGDQLLRRRSLGGELGEPTHLRFAESGEADSAGCRGPGQLADGRLERIPDDRIEIPERADDQDPAVFQ